MKQHNKVKRLLAKQAQHDKEMVDLTRYGFKRARGFIRPGSINK